MVFIVITIKRNPFYQENIVKISMKIYNAWFKESQINVKKIAFGNKEHPTDQKVSVLLRLFISSNEVCNIAYAL